MARGPRARTSAADQAEGGNAASQPENTSRGWVGLTSMEAPLEPDGQLQARRSGCGGMESSSGLRRIRELHLDLWAEVEGKAHVVPAALDFIDDIDAARCPVQQHRATMQSGRVERSVAVVLSRPPGDVAVVDYLHLPACAHDSPT